MSISWKAIVVVVVFSVVAAAQLPAAEHASEQGSDHYHQNVAELFLGGTYEDGDHGDESGFSIGLTYEFELRDRWIVMPEFNVDFVDGEEAFIFGLAFGYGF